MVLISLCHILRLCHSFKGCILPPSCLNLGHLRELLSFPVYLSCIFSSVAQSCPTPCDPMNRSMPGLPVYHQLPEFTQTHVHRISDAIQLSHPLSSPSPPAPSPSQIRVFSNESTLRMRWPKYWSFSFSILPSKEIPRGRNMDTGTLNGNKVGNCLLNFRLCYSQNLSFLCLLMPN